MRINFRRLLPVFAIATGVALVGVTSAFKEAPKSRVADPTYTFEYTAPGGSYTQADVQSKTNWQYTSDSSACSGTLKACKIFATSDDVVPDGTGGYNLNSSFSITASSGSTSHVISTSDGSGSSDLSNRNN